MKCVNVPLNQTRRSDEETRLIRSFNDVLGLNLVKHEDGEATFELTIAPEHCNLHGRVHGGVILSILDVAGIWAGASPGSRAPQSVTASINCCFLRSADKDDRLLRATGTVSKRGKLLYFTSMFVHSEPSGTVLATGQGTYSLLAPRTSGESE